MPADFDHSDRTQPLHAPAALLSAEEIKELRPTASEVAFGRQFAIGSGTLSRLLDALEALTAENARLTEDLADRNSELYAAYHGTAAHREARARKRVEAERDMLKTEVARLKEYVLASEYWRLEPHDQKERSAFIRRLNAAHAAAKEDASDDDPLAILRSAYPAPRLDDGIDMALLSDLCREEPDEATKREVAEMMDGLRARDDSPLSHPDYPALVEMARESSKDGD